MKCASVIVAAAMLFLPLAASADTISELQTEVQALSAMLAQLQQQKAGTAGAATAASATPVSCPSLTSTFGPGSSGSDVSALQQFLAHDPTIYPEGLVTGYYGALTQAAVQRFQTKYGIVSSGSPSTTGYGSVGPKTLAEIQAQCSSGVVGAFMQVSPDSGKAPLYVSVEATVNTTDSCAASTYTLDWGDQSQAISIPVPAGTCQSLQQTYTHTYQNSAAYEITLSSGQYSSQAAVAVQP